MRRLAMLAGATCALALGAGLIGTGSVRADERSPFQLLGTVATSSEAPGALEAAPVRWGWGGYYRPYGSYYGSYYRPYYRSYGSYYRPYGSYYRGYYGYRPYGSYYRPYSGGYYGGYYGYRPGINLWFGF